MNGFPVLHTPVGQRHPAPTPGTLPTAAALLRTGEDAPGRYAPWRIVRLRCAATAGWWTGPDGSDVVRVAGRMVRVIYTHRPCWVVPAGDRPDDWGTPLPRGGYLEVPDPVREWRVWLPASCTDVSTEADEVWLAIGAGGVGPAPWDPHASDPPTTSAIMVGSGAVVSVAASDAARKELWFQNPKGSGNVAVAPDGAGANADLGSWLGYQLAAGESLRLTLRQGANWDWEAKRETPFAATQLLVTEIREPLPWRSLPTVL